MPLAQATVQKYCTTSEMEKKWGISKKTIVKYCNANLIPGAKQDNRKRWQIPENSIRPPLTENKIAKLGYYLEVEEYRVIIQEKMKKEQSITYEELEEYLIRTKVIEKQGEKTVLTQRKRHLLEDKGQTKRNWMSHIKNALVFIAQLVPLIEFAKDLIF